MNPTTTKAAPQLGECHICRESLAPLRHGWVTCRRCHRPYHSIHGVYVCPDCKDGKQNGS